MLLLDKGFYAVEGSVDPATVLWENLGTPIYKKLGRWFGTGSVVFLVLMISFFGLWGIAIFEKLHKQWIRQDCTGNEYYDIDNAFEDFLLPKSK